MKKAMIKRRKRVLPAGQSSEGARDMSASPSPGPDTPREKGSLNPDGSVNLGSKPKPQQQPLSLVPEDVLQRTRQNSPLRPGADLTQYHVASSLTDENRLAPLTSIAATSDRQSTLSPAFISPSRKRSFSSAEMNVPQTAEHDSSKRLSSIKSILNPASGSGATEDRAETPRSSFRSPLPSPAAAASDSEATKAEKRAALQREAEYMRALLAAKERELAEL